VSYYKTINIAEKSMVGTLAYKKFKLEQWFPNTSYRHTPECELKEKRIIRDGHLTNITNNRREKKDNAPRSINTVLKSVKS